MRVTVLKNDTTTNYYFDPQHYQACWDAYAKMQQDGEIQAFSILVER